MIRDELKDLLQEECTHKLQTKQQKPEWKIHFQQKFPCTIL